MPIRPYDLSPLDNGPHTERLMPKTPAKDPRRLRITVILLKRHVAALDRLAVSIRLRAGVSMPRASIIGAFIAAFSLKPAGVVEQTILLTRALLSKGLAPKRRDIEKDHKR